MTLIYLRVEGVLVKACIFMTHSIFLGVPIESFGGMGSCIEHFFGWAGVLPVEIEDILLVAHIQLFIHGILQNNIGHRVHKLQLSIKNGTLFWSCWVL